MLSSIFNIKKSNPKESSLISNLLNSLFKAVQFSLNQPAKLITLALASQVLGSRAIALDPVKNLSLINQNSLNDGIDLNHRLAVIEEKIVSASIPVIANQANIEARKKYSSVLDGKKTTIKRVRRSNFFADSLNYLYEKHSSFVNYLGAMLQDNNTLLRNAAAAGNLPMVRHLKKQGADINAQDLDGWSSLHFAAFEGHLPVVKYLVGQQGANINNKDKRGRDTLHFAIYKNHLLVVKYLVEHGANIHNKGYWDMTPLHLAAEEGYLPIVKYLVGRGANIYSGDRVDLMPLHYAARKGHLPVVKYFVEECEMDVNTTPDDSAPPLYFAAKYGHLLLVKYLIEHGANMDDFYVDGCFVSLIGVAANYGHISIVEYLLQQRNLQHRSRRDLVLQVLDSRSDDDKGKEYGSDKSIIPVSLLFAEAPLPKSISNQVEDKSTTPQLAFEVY